MVNPTRSNHWIQLATVVCFLGSFSPGYSAAQESDGAVPITSEPNHRIRFDNGRVRMYEVVLPRGKATLIHEHRADNFSVIFSNTEITNEPLGGKPVVRKIPSGFVGFASTAKGPYSHRVVASGDEAFHVIAMELMSPTPNGPASANQRAGSPFEVTLENARGRVYRVALASGESTGTFTRTAGSALFAVSAGRISETAEGGSPRLWDFEPGHFRWFDTAESLSMKNESPTPIDLVEIQLF